MAALVAATLFISFTSYKLYEEAIPRLFHPEETTYQNLPLALGVIIVSMLIAAAPLVGVFREKKRGAAAKALLIQLVQDELGLTAALIGTLFILWSQPLADPIATIIVATIIAVTAIGVFRENLSFLLGRSPGQSTWQRLSAWPVPSRECWAFITCGQSTLGQRPFMLAWTFKCNGGNLLRGRIGLPKKYVSGCIRPRAAAIVSSTWTQQKRRVFRVVSGVNS